MANMSYCRWENTLRDLQDCFDALQSGEAKDSDLSSYELSAKKQLIQLCQDMLDEVEFQAENPDMEDEEDFDFGEDDVDEVEEE